MKDHKARLQKSENLYRTIFENTGSATIIIEENGTITLANAEFLNLSGYQKEDIQNRISWIEFIDQKCHKKLLEKKSRPRSGVQHFSAIKNVEGIFIDKNKHQLDVLISLTPIPGTNKSVVSISDISPLKNAERQIYHQAFHDTLTNLPNRELFREHLALAIKRTRRRTDYYFAVLQLDIDRFKLINDSIGHNLGDKLLVAFANKLQRCLRDIDTLARFGGDEFIIILEDIADQDHAIKVLERLQKELQRPFVLDGNEIFASTSFGIVLNTKDYKQPEDIIRDAGTALYHAKMKGRAQFQVFNQNLHEKALHLLQIENDLRKGVENNEFELHYQPIVSVDTAAIIGIEALIRWNHPQRGLVFPDIFISVAEETGLIIPIGKWVLQEACNDLVRWQREIHNDLRLIMSVNISSKQFLRSDIISEIQEILVQSGLPPEQLKLEITETALMEDRKEAIRIIKQLKQLGIQMVIDDFGTGYSSMSYLQQLPVDMLKVDRSFVCKMHQKPDENKKIVETIITLAHKLNMIVVAEGVETPEQHCMLSDMKCQLAQGYLFAKPLNRKKMDRLIRDIAHFAELNPDLPYSLKDMAVN
jgi:diguanylate cyclase (GGDEF)-like protein/PAS domain S-box-containing protein